MNRLELNNNMALTLAPPSGQIQQSLISKELRKVKIVFCFSSIQQTFPVSDGNQRLGACVATESHCRLHLLMWLHVLICHHITNFNVVLLSSCRLLFFCCVVHYSHQACLLFFCLWISVIFILYLIFCCHGMLDYHGKKKTNAELHI